MKKMIKISLEQAKKLYEQQEWKKIVEEAFPELMSSVVKKWEDLAEIQGYYISKDSKLLERLGNLYTIPENEIIAASTAIAKSQKAQSMLSQIAFRANGNQIEEEWLDWEDTKTPKWSIVYDGENLIPFYSENVNFGLIYFKREEDVKLSLKFHKDYWYDYLRVPKSMRKWK